MRNIWRCGGRNGSFQTGKAAVLPTTATRTPAGSSPTASIPPAQVSQPVRDISSLTVEGVSACSSKLQQEHDKTRYEAARAASVDNNRGKRFLRVLVAVNVPHLLPENLTCHLRLRSPSTTRPPTTRDDVAVATSAQP